jgi:hypothetical protein
MSSVPKKIVNVYVDGFNLYHAIAAQDDHRLKWLNLRTLAESYLKRGEVLGRVVFFTAILTWEQQKQARHKNYIVALKANGVEVVESKFRKVSKHCHIMDRYCARYVASGLNFTQNQRFEFAGRGRGQRGRLSVPSR